MKLRNLLTLLMLLLGVDGLMAQLPSSPFDSTQTSPSIDTYQVGKGFGVFKNDKATLRISVFATSRYLNQLGIDESYVNNIGDTLTLQRRQDIQFQKTTIYFKGWMLDPKFRYLVYVWTSNTSQGLGAQVVVAGNVQYQINKFLDVGVGIAGNPTTRSLLGQWPFWLRQDARPMAEEFFRGSFTTGVWLQGELAKGLYYKGMVGNNLSQLGIDAGQLDNFLNTYSLALWYCTGDYPRNAPFGDYQNTQKFSTRWGVHATTSTEDPQSQPGSDDPENSQIRLSDGRGVFNLGTFGQGVLVTKAQYNMFAGNVGFIYKGFSLDVEGYYRRVTDIKVNQGDPIDDLEDSGFSARASGMIIDELLQIYGFGSYINGEQGDPFEVGLGLNVYPFKTRNLRFNPEYFYVENSPVGYQSYPSVVGANGGIFMMNMEIFF
ncbi:hypothetical protein [Pontibacter sp. G13]|uniref:hypothetical protein n=1 Tax=Pontibacter sp. G13 TaxID=3074898 RepID=UPI00288940C2|nr:hypothetical protein [Pontibacter sp. G13]WNJ18187.1 hypothetical protein RJD25_25330 [Pontibacter sp. G13]